jgi:hypothetical protein
MNFSKIGTVERIIDDALYKNLDWDRSLLPENEKPYLLKKLSTEPKSKYVLMTSAFFCINTIGEKRGLFSWASLQSVSLKEVRGKFKIFLLFESTLGKAKNEITIKNLKGPEPQHIYRIIKEISLGFSVKEPDFIIMDKQQKLLYKSRPHLYLFSKMRSNREICDTVSAYICSRPTILYLSHFEKHDPKVMYPILKAAEISGNLRTVVVDISLNSYNCDIIMRFIKESRRIQKVIFNATDDSSVERIIRVMDQSSICEIEFKSYQMTANTVELLKYIFSRKTGKNLDSLTFSESIISYDFDYFLCEVVPKLELFNNLKSFTIDRIVSYPQTVFYPGNLFKAAFGIPHVGLNNSLISIGYLPYILKECPQAVPGKSIDLSLQGLICIDDFFEPILFEANLSSIDLSNSKWSVTNFIKILNAFVHYRSNNITIDLSHTEILGNAWTEIWKGMKNIKKSSEYVIGFIWDENTISGELFDFLMQFPNLRKISIGKPHGISEDLVDKMKTLLIKAEYINYIDISDWKMSENMINPLFPIIASKNYIETLHVGGNTTYTQNTKNQLLTTIKEKETLKEISFYSTGWDFTSVNNFVKSIRSAPNLRKTALMLHWNPNFTACSLNLAPQRSEINELYEMFHELKKLPVAEVKYDYPTPVFFPTTPTREAFEACSDATSPSADFFLRAEPALETMKDKDEPKKDIILQSVLKLDVEKKENKKKIKENPLTKFMSSRGASELLIAPENPDKMPFFTPLKIPEDVDCPSPYRFMSSDCEEDKHQEDKHEEDKQEDDEYEYEYEDDEPEEEFIEENIDNFITGVLGNKLSALEADFEENEDEAEEDGEKWKNFNAFIDEEEKPKLGFLPKVNVSSSKLKKFEKNRFPLKSIVSRVGIIKKTK